MKFRGFSDTVIHPKHLFDENRSNLLYSMFKPGINFLDLGSGVGSDCIVAKQKGVLNAVEVESNRNNIDIAVLRAQQRGVQVEFIQYDLEQAALPFKDDTFDLVNFSNVLEHLNNRVAVLRDLKHKKKNEGIVVISIPNTNTSWKIKLRSVGLDSYDDSDHKIEYTPNSLKDELGRADLKIISDLHPIVPSFPWNGIISMSAAVSPRLYRKLQVAKRRYVEKNPEESIGWVFITQ